MHFLWCIQLIIIMQFNDFDIFWPIFVCHFWRFGWHFWQICDFGDNFGVVCTHVPRIYFLLKACFWNNVLKCIILNITQKQKYLKTVKSNGNDSSVIPLPSKTLRRDPIQFRSRRWHKCMRSARILQQTSHVKACWAIKMCVIRYWQQLRNKCFVCHFESEMIQKLALAIYLIIYLFDYDYEWLFLLLEKASFQLIEMCLGSQFR